MLHRLTICIAGPVLTAALAAQSTTFTSPKGLDLVEGNASFFASTNRTYQGLDATHLGTVYIIKSFAMRRDKNSASRAGASTVDATLVMGETNMMVTHSDPSRNYSVKKTEVFPKKQVNWPDWGAPSTTPAPFDFQIPFNAAYIYLGLDSLVWQLTLENGTNTGNVFDRDYTFYQSGSSSSLGSGCGSFNHTHVMESNGAPMKNYGMRLKTGVTGAPAGTPVVLSVALTGTSVSIPGWCSNVYAVPAVTVPIGVANASGQIFNCYFNTAYNPGLNGLNLFTQAFSITGGNITLSNGMRGTMPTSANNASHDAGYVWHTLGGNPNGFVFHGGSIIAQFGT